MKRVQKVVSSTCAALLIYNIAFANNVTESVYNNVYSNDNKDSVTEFVYDSSFLEYLDNISLNFTDKIKINLNPYQINGEEQVTSNDIVIENTGEVPISIKLKKCNIEINDKSDVVFSSNNYLNEDSNLKEAFLYIYEDGESKFNKILDGEMDMDFGMLAQGEKKILKIGGELSTNTLWSKDDEFSLKFSFKFEPLEYLAQDTVNQFVYN